MLNDNSAKEKELEGLITKLGLVADYAKSNTQEDKKNILLTQSAILKKTKLLLHQKQFDKLWLRLLTKAKLTIRNFSGQLVIDTKAYKIMKLPKKTEFFFNVNAIDCDNFIFRYEIEPNVKFATSVSL